MRLIDNKSVWRLASGLILVMQTSLVTAEEAQGLMAVSLTVLPSCSVNVPPSLTANSLKQSLPINADVTCPQSFPYRARISSAVTTGSIPYNIDSIPFHTGAQQLDLSQFSTQSTSSTEGSYRLLLLTISY